MKNISKYLIKPNSKLNYALKKISKSGEKILIVVNSERVLLGTITDGDLRRSILKNNNLNQSIKKVFNTKPIFFQKNSYSKDLLIKTFIKKKINAIPITNIKKKIVDIVFFNNAVFQKKAKNKDKKKLDVPCVIMAGGRGTRLEPFTKILPKPLIPINNKAIIEHIIDGLKFSRINNIFMTINYKSLLIKSYFKDLKLKSKISFIEEKEKRGTIGGIKVLEKKFKKPFFVTNCDILIKIDHADLYDFHLKNDSDITIVASTRKFKIPYGVCKIDTKSGNLKNILEKPEYNYLVNTGLYILSPRVFKYIPSQKKFDMTDLINVVDKKKINVFPIHNNDWVDVGQWPEYNRASKIK